MSGDEAREVTPASIDRPHHEVFLDARGPERGPTAIEWRVIATYKAIESMTATEPSRDVVDQTLDQLMSHAAQYPENPYIQELYLKGLRVANYYAVAAEDEVRAFELEVRFVDHAARFMDYEGTVLESMRLQVQRHEQRCYRGSTYDAELLVAVERFVGSEAVEELLEARAGRC